MPRPRIRRYVGSFAVLDHGGGGHDAHGDRCKPSQVTVRVEPSAGDGSGAELVIGGLPSK